MEPTTVKPRPDEHKAASSINKAMRLQGYRWQPGQSGNPLGKPKTALVSAAILGFYLANPRELARFVLAAHKFAIKGNAKFWEMICDRLEGKVPLAIAHSGTIHHSIDDNQRAEIDQMTAIMNVIDVEPTDIQPK